MVLSLNCVCGKKDRFFASTAQRWREALSCCVKQGAHPDVVYMQTHDVNILLQDFVHTSTYLFIYFLGLD